MEGTKGNSVVLPSQTDCCLLGNSLSLVDFEDQVCIVEGCVPWRRRGSMQPPVIHGGTGSLEGSLRPIDRDTLKMSRVLSNAVMGML